MAPTQSEAESWLEKNNLHVKETVWTDWTVTDFRELTNIIRMPTFSTTLKDFSTFCFSFELDARNNLNDDRVILQFRPHWYKSPLRYRVAFGRSSASNYQEFLYDPIYGDSCFAIFDYYDCKQRSFRHRGDIFDLVFKFDVDILMPKPKPSEPRIKLIDTIDVQGYILENYQNLLESGECSDFVLLVGAKQFRVHKAILAAQSEVFKTMFNTDLDEKKMNRAEITDIDVEVFEAMLTYIYGGKINKLKDLAIELLAAADKYQLKHLKSICERSQSLSLTIESVVNSLVIADMHQAAVLKSECIAYIGANSAAVKSTDSWKMMISRPDLLMELFEKLSIKPT